MKFGPRAFPIEVTTKIMAEIVSSHLRPKRSLTRRLPWRRTSTRQARLLAQPERKLSDMVPELP